MERGCFWLEDVREKDLAPAACLKKNRLTTGSSSGQIQRERVSEGSVQLNLFDSYLNLPRTFPGGTWVRGLAIR